MSTPSTMLGLAAHMQRQTQRASSKSVRRVQVRVVLKRALATIAVMIGLSSMTMGSAQAWIFDDMKDNIASTIVNMCGPNDVSAPTTYQNIDTLAGLNKNPSKGSRETVLPDFSEDEGGSGGGEARERLQKVYGEKATTIAPTIAPTYERYGFSSLRWNQYGYDCFSPTLLMGPASNMALFSMVHVPMMISMSVLNLAMDNTLYTGFAEMMNPFIGGMYSLFSPWIFFVVPIGIFLTWLMSKGSLQATAKAAAWGVFMLAVFTLMGQSTSRFVTWSTNIVTEVSGSAACKMNAATADDKSGAEDKCDSDDPIKSVNQALWYGVPYQTWLVGQVGEAEAAKDQKAGDDEVTWGAAILNGNYVGVNKDGDVDKKGRKVIEDVEAWNGQPYTDDGKVQDWGKHDRWSSVPALTNVKLLCNDQDKLDNDPEGDPSKEQRWMFSGAAGQDDDGGSYYCDTAGAGTTAMASNFRGDEYNKQFLTALSGMVGVGAVSLTIGAAAVYLAFQKMSFFFLLFFAPVVLTIASVGDSKRRPFAVRYAELIGANLLKQVAAVCIVLFVSNAMASLFGSGGFSSVPWILKPYVAGIFFLALVGMAFPMKNLLKGAVQGDTSSLDKIADAPANVAKTTAKVAAVGAAVTATGGLAAAGGGGIAMGGMGGKAAALGKGGTMLGQAGKVMGHGSKTGKVMRRTGALMKARQGVLESQDAMRGKQAAVGQAAVSLINGPEGKKYRDEKGQLLPDAQKMAKKDVVQMSEAGQKSDRASKAQEQQMAAFFSGYKATTGHHHRDDPTSPDNKRASRLRAEHQRRRARGDANDLGGEEPTRQPRTRPKPPHGPGSGPEPHRPGGSGAPRGGPSRDSGGGGGAAAEAGQEGGTTVLGEGHNEGRIDFTDTKEGFQERARANLGGPAFAREMDYNVATAATGEEVLRKNGLTNEEVLADPTTLLRGDAYEGGSTTKMDPFNPATSALNELRFASASGDEDAMESAVAKSVDALQQHGVPDQITGVSSIGDRAQAFESIELLGAIPSVTQDSPWHERADAAQTMMAAQVAMPEDYTGRQAVEDYTSALANPAVDSALLDAVKTRAVEDLGGSMEVIDPVTTTGPEPHTTNPGLAPSGQAALDLDGHNDAGRRSSGESHTASGDLPTTGPSNVPYSGDVPAVQEPNSGSFDSRQVPAGEAPLTAEEPQSNGGSLHDDVRQAVSEALREMQQEERFSETPVEESPANVETSGDALATPSAPSDGDPPKERHVPRSLSSRSADELSGSSEEAVITVDDGPIIFRPPTKHDKARGKDEVW